MQSFGAPITTETPGYMWISGEISLAITPVFLLTAIVTILLLLSGRMARIADRFVTEDSTTSETDAHMMKGLLLRMRLTQSAILCAVAAGLLISMVVVLIFLSDTILGDLSAAIMVAFIAAMGFIWLALALFLVEISYAAARTARDLID